MSVRTHLRHCIDQEHLLHTNPTTATPTQPSVSTCPSQLLWLLDRADPLAQEVRVHSMSNTAGMAHLSYGEEFLEWSLLLASPASPGVRWRSRRGRILRGHCTCSTAGAVPVAKRILT